MYVYLSPNAHQCCLIMHNMHTEDGAGVRDGNLPIIFSKKLKT